MNTTLKQLLEIAGEDPAARTGSAAHDLALVRARLHRRRTTIAGATTAAVVVAAGGAWGVAALTSGTTTHHPQADGAPSPGIAHSPTPKRSATPRPRPAALVDHTLTASPYTFPKSPKGWHVQAVRAWGAVIAPDDGSTSKDPSDFEGKILVSASKGHGPSGGKVIRSHGRSFHVTMNAGAHMSLIEVAPKPGEPGDDLIGQFPPSLGWDARTMITFLDAVTVNGSAAPVTD